MEDTRPPHAQSSSTLAMVLHTAASELRREGIVMGG